MAEYIDIALEQTGGVFDISVDETGDLTRVVGFDTNLQMSLFAERRAAPSEMPESSLRRGWWGNVTGDDLSFQIGSKLWTLEQVRNTPLVLNKAIDYARQAVQWLVDDGLLKDVKVTGEFIENGIQLQLLLVRDQSNTESKYYSLWDNTGRI